MTWIPLSKFEKLQGSAQYEFYCFNSWALRDGELFFSGGKKVRKCNVAAFEIVDAECSYVARDDESVFHGPTRQKAIDRATFEYLGDRYYRDKSLAYFEYETSLKPLKGRDSKNFKSLGFGYARDSSFGYFSGATIKKCTSPMSLRVIKAADEKTMDYAMDEEFVYCEGRALNGADLESWEPRVRGFSIDKNTVFYDRDRLARVDVGSWQHISSCYSRDKDRVYHMKRQLKKACPDQWKLLDDNYSTDGERVYYMGRLVEGADATTFQISSDGKASDQGGAFDGGQRS